VPSQSFTGVINPLSGSTSAGTSTDCVLVASFPNDNCLHLGFGAGVAVTAKWIAVTVQPRERPRDASPLVEQSVWLFDVSTRQLVSRFDSGTHDPNCLGCAGYSTMPMLVASGQLLVVAWAGLDKVHVYQDADTPQLVGKVTHEFAIAASGYESWKSLACNGHLLVIGEATHVHEARVSVYPLVLSPLEPVYVYPPGDVTVIEPKYNSFGAGVALSETQMVVGAPTVHPDGGRAYGYTCGAPSPASPPGVRTGSYGYYYNEG